MKHTTIGIVVLVACLTSVVAAAATTEGAGSVATRTACARGAVAATVSGKKTCLTAGQACKATLNRSYKAHGFTCLAGHLRKTTTAKAPAPTPTPTPTPTGPPPVAGPPSGPFTLTSPAFSEGGAIPTKYTCDSQFVSPPLAWTGVPATTQSLAIMLDDPDAPDGGFTHWITYNLPWQPGQLAEGAIVANAGLGRNDAGSNRYFPPCPPGPDGPHHYVFHLYALNAFMGFQAAPTRTVFLKSIAGVTLGEAKLTVTYDH